MPNSASENTSISWQPTLVSLWQRLQSVFPKISVNRRRTLRLCESLSLGEKRIVAVIECDDQRYLLGATPQNVSLLQALGPAQTQEKPGNQS